MSDRLAEVLVGRPHHARSVPTGVVIGIVTNNKDPDKLNRVRVKFPSLSEAEEDSFWARVATPMAGNGRGLYFLPEPHDEVLVAFLNGDMNHPYIIGALWNGKDKPPVENTDGDNNVRVIKSRSGAVVKFNDKGGSETFEIVDASGKNSIVINTKDNSITITSEKDISLAAPKGKVRISAQTIEIEATGTPDATSPNKGTAKFTASSKMTVHATDDLTVQGKTVNINC